MIQVGSDPSGDGERKGRQGEGIAQNGDCSPGGFK